MTHIHLHASQPHSICMYSEYSHRRGRMIVRLISSLTRLDLAKEENMLLFVRSESVEFNLVNLETSHTVILPPIVSVL